MIRIRLGVSNDIYYQSGPITVSISTAFFLKMTIPKTLSEEPQLIHQDSAMSHEVI